MPSLPSERGSHTHYYEGSLCGESRPPATAAPTASERSIGHFLGDRRMDGVLLKLAPMRHHVRAIAVNLQPGDGLREHRSVQQTSLRPRRRVDVEQPRLERDDLVEPLDVAP